MDKIFSDRITDVPRSFIREILKVALDPTVISFAGGLPISGEDKKPFMSLIPDNTSLAALAVRERQNITTAYEYDLTSALKAV